MMEESHRLPVNSKLHLILLPTEQCNFRCVYCYEKFDIGQMPPTVITGVKNLLRVRAPELKELHVSWFGGEPLVAFKVIQDVMSYIIDLLPGAPDLQVRSNITTNAWLLDRSTLQKLNDLRVTDYQISFDGDRDLHDTLRVSASHKGTFDRIWANVVDAHRSDVPFNMVLRVHANTKNESSILSFMERFAREIGPDPRYRLFVRSLERLGGPSDSSLPILGEGEMPKVMERVRAYATSLGLDHLLFNPESDTETGLAVCYAALVNSLVIRADGRLAKCTVAFCDDRNTIGKINADGTMEIDRAKLAWWARGLFSGDKAQLYCPNQAG